MGEAEIMVLGRSFQPVGDHVEMLTQRGGMVAPGRGAVEFDRQLRFEVYVVRLVINLGRVNAGAQHARNVHRTPTSSGKEVLRKVEQAVEQQYH